MDYIKEYGLELIKNASGDPDKEPEVTVDKGTIVLNKAAATNIGLEFRPNVEIRGGKQTGAIVYAITTVDVGNNNTVTAKLLKNGTAKIAFKKPMKAFRLDYKKSYTIDLIECEDGLLVFAFLVDMPEKKQTETTVSRPAPSAPFGPVGAEFGLIGETRIEGSDF